MKQALVWIDGKLNAITMYRLILYYLLIVFFVAVVFGFLNIISSNPYYLLAEGAFITSVAYITNLIFSKVFMAPTNVESVYITSLILTLVIPVSSPGESIMFYIFAPVLAMASKYVFAIRKKHVFNPVAASIALTSLALGDTADWWAGSTLMLLPIILIGGILIVRKIRRTDLVMSFFIAFIVATTLSTLFRHGDIMNVFVQALKHSPIFFFAFVMITEPLTTPPTKWLRVIYGAIIGAMSMPTASLFGFGFTPELSLILGNLFSFLVSPKEKYLLTLKEKKEVAKDTYNFYFNTDKPTKFIPGQYLEWTLPHEKYDNRGNRRYFTIASSPTEEGIQLGVKFYPSPSTFKQELTSLKVGDSMSAGALAGDFILPKNKNEKLVFIAGGIGVTPFRSMIKYMIDKNESRNLIMFYSNKTIDEVAYTDVFDEAVDKLGIKIVYTLTDNIPETWRGGRGFVTADMIKKEAPDYKERYFYISGPHGMVSSFEKTLSDIGVPSSQIKVDFFPGFA